MLGSGDGNGAACGVGVVLIGEERRIAPPGDEAGCMANGTVFGLGEVEEPAAAAALALGDVSSTSSEGLSESENVPTTWKGTNGVGWMGWNENRVRHAERESTSDGDGADCSGGGGGGGEPPLHAKAS